MIQVAYPWVFIALIVPVLTYLLLPNKRDYAQNENALKVPFYRNLQEVFGTSITNQDNQNKTYLKYLAIIIWCLIVTAASGIKWLGNPIAIPQTGRDLLLAIDLSGSMQSQDMEINGQYLNRADIVKTVANDFINKRSGDRIGLILFGSKAYLQTPLTFDKATVQQMLNDATIGIAGPQTAIGDSIGLAVKSTLNNPSKSKALILLTDGGNNSGVLDPIKAAELAKQANLKIYTIGIGASQMVVPGLFGNRIVNPSGDLDIETLKKIANITGGEYYRAEDGNELAQIYSIINQLEPTKSDELTIRPVTELYPWPLGVAVILSFLLILLNIKRNTNVNQ